MSPILLAIRSRVIRFTIASIYFLIIIPFLIFAVTLIRIFKKKTIDIGLGPEPMINNVYHKKALLQYGYSAETFVNSVYFITSEFDYRGDLSMFARHRVLKIFSGIALFLRAVGRYKCVYIYYNGGPFAGSAFLEKIEPQLLRMAGTKVVVMPYGGDVYNMFDCNNLQLKHAMSTDYPEYHKSNQKVRRQILRWTSAADKVISGCDWVDYMHHWDKLTIAHFSIDIERFEKLRAPVATKVTYTSERPLRILHAPNHKTIKGTSYIQKAIDELIAENYPVELIFLQKRPNHEIIEEISKADIIADQLVIGWYAMFALESMALAKPVICYLREDLINLYLFSGLLENQDEIPFLNTNVFGIKQLLKDVLDGKVDLVEHSQKSLNYVTKYHSTKYIGKVFDEINRELGIMPSMQRS